LLIATEATDSVSTNFDIQIDLTLDDIVREIQYELFNQSRKTWIADPAGGNGMYGYPAGIKWLINNNQVRLFTPGTAGTKVAFTQQILKDFLYEHVIDYGNPLVLVTGYKHQGEISTWNETFSYTQVTDTTAGLNTGIGGRFVGTLISPYTNQPLEVFIDKTIPDDRVYIVNPAGISVKWKMIDFESYLNAYQSLYNNLATFYPQVQGIYSLWQQQRSINTPEADRTFIPLLIENVRLPGEDVRWYQISGSYTFRYDFPKQNIGVINNLL